MIEVIHFGLSENKGGIESYLKRITENIDRKKVHFSFIDMTGEDSIPCIQEELECFGADFYKITPRRKSVLQNRRELEYLFKNHSFDILHFHVNTLSYITPVEIALKYNCKVIIHSRSGSASSLRITRLLHEINKCRIRKWPVVRIAVSELAGKWLFGESSKYYIFNNAIDTRKFKFDLEMRVKTRNVLKCENCFVIGHVGAFLPVKNHEFLLNILAEIIKYDLNVRLWLIGDGPLKPRIENMAAELGILEKIHFLGVRDDVNNLYSGMDLFVFPSEFEGFPNAVLEAQCEGIPCLISDSITREVDILDCVYRISIKHSKEEWVEKILYLSKEKLKDDRYRKAASGIIDKRGFSVEVEKRRLENLYTWLAKKTDEKNRVHI